MQRLSKSWSALLAALLPADLLDAGHDVARHVIAIGGPSPHGAQGRLHPTGTDLRLRGSGRQDLRHVALRDRQTQPNAYRAATGDRWRGQTKRRPSGVSGRSARQLIFPLPSDGQGSCRPDARQSRPPGSAQDARRPGLLEDPSRPSSSPATRRPRAAPGHLAYRRRTTFSGRKSCSGSKVLCRRTTLLRQKSCLRELFRPGVPNEATKLDHKRNYRGTGTLFPIAVMAAAWQRGPAMDSQTNSEIWFHEIGTLITASLVISIALVLISAIR